MDDLDAITRLPDDFDGRVRLFPLPDLVLFPHAMQPLHIFEPRYCEMLNEALAGDHLIAMATLTGGDSASVMAEPTIASTVCLGRIISHAEVEEGDTKDRQYTAGGGGQTKLKKSGTRDGREATYDLSSKVPGAAH